jgi:diguanylate cyclase (GGDEF)-like protein/PAS domain S-box-containing protein
MRVLKGYAIAAVSVTLALVLTLKIAPLHQQFKFLLFFLAVFASASAGIWPGLLATLLSVLLTDYFLIEPLHSFAISGPADLVPMLVFSGAGFAITWVIHRSRRSEEATHTAAAVIESSADSIIRTSLDNTILSWNRAAERTYGYSADEVIDRSLWLIVPPDYTDELDRLTEQVRQGRSIQNHETVCANKDGGRVEVALTLSPVQDRDGKIVAMSIIARDIGERKRAEEAIRESHQKLEQQTHQLKLLAEMGDLLQASSTPADAYAVASHFVQKLIPATSGAVFAYFAPTKELEVVNRWGEVQPNEPDLLSPDSCWALRTGRAHFVREPDTSLLCRHLPDPPPACYFCVPLIAHSETLGMLHFRLSSSRQASSGEASSELAEFPWPATSIADQLALAVANMKLREALRAQSIRDPLTGWFNRRYMEETLEREVLRAARNRHSLAVIMLDVDHFKGFNDSFGHEAGDTVLQKLCQMMKSRIRNEDVACRYGGDEFVLVLPDTSAELAARRAEELRTAVAEMGMRYQGQSPGLLTLSVGVATFPTDGSTPKELLRASDSALLRAKSEGRDRVRLHNGI